MKGREGASIAEIDEVDEIVVGGYGGRLRRSRRACLFEFDGFGEAVRLAEHATSSTSSISSFVLVMNHLSVQKRPLACGSLKAVDLCFGVARGYFFYRVKSGVYSFLIARAFVRDYACNHGRLHCVITRDYARDRGWLQA